ncbi:hypothetical protein ACFL0N_02100 [Pseudomonadota bacterium]
MKFSYWSLTLCLCALFLSSVTSSVQAQDYDYHPYLSDKLYVSLGWMRSSNSFTLESDLGDDIGDEIDFDDSLGVSDHSTFFNGQLRWAFDSERKWLLSGQYFSNNAKGSAELLEDVEWDGVTWKKGTFVDSGAKLSVSRLFLGYSFFKNERNDFGFGIGIHNLKIKAFIEGEVIIDDETSEFQEGDVSESQILPNIGGWYAFSPARDWLLHARVDWIGASIGDYDGHMWNMNIGVNWQAFRHVGFDLSWQYFNLDVSVDSDDWTGGADMTYSGPVIAVTGNW